MIITLHSDLPPIDKYCELFQTAGWKFRREVTPDVLQMSLEKSWYCLFAWDGDRLVGCGRIVTDGLLHAIIYDVIVEPDYQNQGIGRQIVGELVQKCTAAGIGTIQLFAAKNKQAFYEHLGFAVRPSDGPGMQYSGE